MYIYCKQVHCVSIERSKDLVEKKDYCSVIAALVTHYVDIKLRCLLRRRALITAHIPRQAQICAIILKIKYAFLQCN